MRKLFFALMATGLFSAKFSTGFAATTIDAVNHDAYGANLGWINWVGDTNHGAVVGEYVCSGSIYSGNVGWISLGNGSPTNGIQYQNLSANDFGVNHDGLGNLRGFAYGGNIGWLNFETNGAPKVNLLTGQMSGYVWSANCGWISLSNAVASVQTDTINPGAMAPDGLPVAWLLLNFDTTNVDANADADGDGLSNEQEYLAGTDPNNAGSNLKITGCNIQPGGANVSLTWNSVATRFYYVQKSPDLTGTNWTDSGLGIISPNPGGTTGNFTDAAATAGFYRVQAVLPLSP